MKKQTPTPDILFARFRLNIDPIADYRVRVLDFPAQEAIREFKNAIRSLREPQEEEDAIALEELEPWRRLNAALLYLAPSLIHGFEKKAPWIVERSAIVLGTRSPSPRHAIPSVRSRLQAKPATQEDAESREAVVLSSIADEQDIWYPSRDQVCEIIAEWAKQWVEATFADELQLRDGKELAQNLYEMIVDQPEHDWQERTIGEVWRQSDQQAVSLRWKTIPSLLAMLFVSRSPSTILGDEEGVRQKLTWNLVHDKDTGLSVISDPVPARSKQGEGLIAYKLDFRVQTQAGDVNTPWIALYISLRRYADHPVRKKNKGAVSVWIRMGTRIRKTGWGASQTLVRLAAMGRIRAGKQGVTYELIWRDRLPALIKAVRGRPPSKANAIFETPSSFNRRDNPSKVNDTFLITHAEGMQYQFEGKRGGHPIQSGTSLKERIDLFNEVVATLGDILSADIEMEVDPHVTLSSTQIKRSNIHGLWTWDDLHARFDADSQKAQRERAFHAQLLYDAIQHATQSRPIHIWILHQSEQKPLVIEKYLHEMLFISSDTPLPDTMQIHYMQFADEQGSLAAPLTIEFDVRAYNSGDKAAIRTMNAKFKADWRDVYEQRLARIEAFFSRHIPSDGVSFALIELHKGFNHERLRDQWLKYLLRRACVEKNICSQMMRPLDERAIDTKKYPPGRAHVGRLKNSLRDLMLRQTATLFGHPGALYQYAGLDAELANQLCVIGLFRHRDQTGLDFPIAVRMFANGKCDFVLADPLTGHPLEPVSYVNGAELGKYLVNQPTRQLDFRARRNADFERRSRLARFAIDVITQANDSQPTLVLLDGDGWRQEGVLPVADGKTLYNTLDLSSLAGHQRYLPEDLPNIRIGRIRDAGTLGETPQYVQVQGDLWGDYLHTGDIDHMTLVRDTQTKSAIPHAFSIGRRLLSMGTGKDKQNNEVYSFSDGADIAHKHQQAVEIALLFHQPDDDVALWLRLPHLLRISPAWSGGNIALPYPIHLAKALVKDMLALIKPKLNRRQLLK